VNARIQGLHNAARPDFGPSWQLQVQVQFLFSKHSNEADDVRSR
jgi:hypothetical protein